MYGGCVSQDICAATSRGINDRSTYSRWRKNPCSPDVAIAGGFVAALVSGLRDFEIFADSIERQAIRRTHYRRCIPVRTQTSCLDQRFDFGCESRLSRDMSKFGKISSMEYAAKAGLCRRLSRRVNITASNHPVKAPRNASVIERLLKVRSPWPVRRNPV